MDTLTMRENTRRYGIDRPMLSIRATMQLIRTLGMAVSYNGDVNEFRVNFKEKHGGTTMTAYYTSDREDALQTARAMSAFICQPCVQGEGRTEHDHDSITR